MKANPAVPAGPSQAALFDVETPGMGLDADANAGAGELHGETEARDSVHDISNDLKSLGFF